MKIESRLGVVISVRQKLKIADFVVLNPTGMAPLVRAFLGPDYRTTQNAAWILSTVAARKQALLQPYLSKIVRYAALETATDAVKRNVMRLLQFTDLPPRLHGRIADLAYKLFGDRRQAVAIRVFSMSILGRLAVLYPAMKEELICRINDELPYVSAAFVSRGNKVRKRLESGNAL